MQISEQDFQQMLQDISITTICSIDDPIREEDSETRLSLLVDEKAKNPEFQVNEFYLKESLAKAIERLTEKERTVVSLFYFEEFSLSEIAEVMCLSPSRISQLHSKAILRLKGVLGRFKNQLISRYLTYNLKVWKGGMSMSERNMPLDFYISISVSDDKLTAYLLINNADDDFKVSVGQL